MKDDSSRKAFALSEKLLSHPDIDNYEAVMVANEPDRKEYAVLLTVDGQMIEARLSGPRDIERLFSFVEHVKTIGSTVLLLHGKVDGTAWRSAWREGL